jgi:plastocyanin
VPSGGTATTVSVAAGLVVGISFIVIFSLMFQIRGTSNPSEVSIVTIPENAQSNGFEPKVIKVVIGVNNTVSWINHDSIPSSVYADNEDDPLFYEATRDQCVNNDYYNNICVAIPGKNTLMPGGTFEFTFTKPGTFGYHSVPHPQMKGTVVVYPKNWQMIGYVPTVPAIHEVQAIESVKDYLNQRVNNFAGITLYSTLPTIPPNHSRYLNATEFFRLGDHLPLRFYPSDTSSDSFYSIDPVTHKITGKCMNTACLPVNEEYAIKLRGNLLYTVDSAWLYRTSNGQLVNLPDGFFVDVYTGDVVATSFRCPEVKQEWCK